MVDYFRNTPLTKTLKKTFKTGKGTIIEEEIEKANELPTIEGFCTSIGIAKQTLFNWMKTNKELVDAYVYVKQIFRDFIIKNGITGRYDSRFAMFVAINDTDMRNITEVSVRGEVEHHVDPEQMELLREVAKGFIEQKRLQITNKIDNLEETKG